MSLSNGVFLERGFRKMAKIYRLRKGGDLKFSNNTSNILILKVTIFQQLAFIRFRVIKKCRCKFNHTPPPPPVTSTP